MSIASVVRELLVRYLDIWTPTALHGSRRACFVQAWDGTPDPETAGAALRVFAEFADRLAGRKLTVVLLAPDSAALAAAVAALPADPSPPPELEVHPVAGDRHRQLGPVLRAAGTAGAPLLGYVDTSTPGSSPGTGSPGADSRGGGPGSGRPVTGTETTAGLVARAGKPAELILITDPGGWAGHRDALRGAGFPLTVGVELVGSDGSARLLAFGTPSTKRLEAFKDALWAVDEYAGVRLRDPRDPDGELLDISLKPQPAPLRRELLHHLTATGAASVADIRRFTLTETVYRTADTTRALAALLAAGTLTRQPEHGRLSGDVVISLAR